MDRTRGINWFARLTATAGLVVFATLLLGAQPGSAAPTPTVPIGPTDFAPPVADPSPPTTPTTTTPTTAKPATPAKPKPIKPVTRAKPAATTTTAPTTTAPPPPTTTTTTTDIPMPNRVDSGGGMPEGPTVLFWAIPGLAVLTLASGVSGYWLARSEQDRR